MRDGVPSATMAEDWRIDRVEQIKALIHKAEPDVVEEVKWRKPSNPDGVPTFSLDGLIGTVETYKDKVKVTFARGGLVADPKGLFTTPPGATRRVIDLFEGDQLDVDGFTELICDAVRVNRDRKK